MSGSHISDFSWPFRSNSLLTQNFSRSKFVLS